MAGMSMFSLLFALLSGGANDLLDFVSTDAYWQAKGTVVTVDQLTAELKTPAAADVSEFIKAMGSGNFQAREEATKKIIAVGPAAIPALEKASDDPDAEIANRARSLVQQIKLNQKAGGVRKLMAIRTLGEQKKTEGLPALKALLDSKEMFVAEYAARSIALIEGKPAPARPVARDEIKADLSLLPAKCGIVAQSLFASDRVILFNDIMKSIPPQPGEDRKAMLEAMAKNVIEIADQIGNVRLESFTIGVADVVGDKDGFVVAIAHGEYDSKAVANYVRKMIPNTENVEGYDVVAPDDHSAFAFISDNRAIAFTGASKDKLPIKEVLANTRAKTPAPNALLAGADFAPFIAKLDDKVRAWAVCKVSDSYRQAPFIQPFDTMTLLTTQNKDGVDIRIAGEGKDAASVKGAVDMVNKGLNEARGQLPQMAQQIPMLKPVNDFVQAVKCAADGKTASLTGTFQGDPAMLMAMPFMMMGARMEGGQAAPPVRVQENVQPDQPQKK